MTDNKLHDQLTHIAEEHIPDGSVDLWASIEGKLGGELAPPEQTHTRLHSPGERRPPRRHNAALGLTVAVGVSLLLIAFAAFLRNPVVTPSEADATLSHEHTPAPAIINGTAVWRNLTITEAQQAIDFPIWQPTTLSESWRYNGASVDTAACLVTQRYVLTRGDHLTIQQSCKPDPLLLKTGESVQVGDEQGIYDVIPQGVGSEATIIEWSEGRYTFALMHTRGDSLTVDDLIAVAEGLELRRTR